MRKYLGRYKPYFTESFKETLNMLNKKQNKIVLDKVNDILRDPWHNQKPMKGQYKGKRHRYINRKDRIIYAICEDCRENRWQNYNLCSDCSNTPDELVIFVQIILDHKY